MKTIVAPKQTNTIPLSEITNETINNLVVILEQNGKFGLLTHDTAFSKDREGNNVRRWFFSPFDADSKTSSYWYGGSSTGKVEQFLAPFVISDTSKVHVFSDVKEMAIYIAGKTNT